MREESTFEGQPEQPGFRRRCIWVGMLAGILALGLLLFGLLNREPRYQGKTSTQWFPYSWDLSKGPIPGASLTNGAPETFPVLWAALHAKEPAWSSLYFGILSPLHTVLKLPPPLSVAFLHAEAARAILKSSVSPPFAELVGEHWRELSWNLRVELISDLGNERRMQAFVPQVGENLKPILLRLLEDKDPHLQTLAAYVLLRVRGLPEPALQRLGRIGRGLPSGMVQTSDYRIRLGLYRGSGMEGRRILAEALSGGQAVAEDRVQLYLCLLDPVRFPPDQYWESTGSLLRDWTRRRVVVELIEFALGSGGADEIGVWLGKLLVSDLRFTDRPEKEGIWNRTLNSERLRILGSIGAAIGPNPQWMDGLVSGLSATSPRVRTAAAKAIVAGRGATPTVLAAATAGLLRRQDPELMLRILTVAKVVPPEVAPLVQKLAAGETPAGWPPSSDTLIDEARMLLTAASGTR